ncbi:MAG: exosortase A-associated hydrolase 1, partial [Gammaproteobacteria bacterium]
MPLNETPIAFDCAGAPSTAILHSVSTEAKVGIVIIVGGPQYRVGSHRQFVLLARALAENGIPVLRFDHRGTGDCANDAVAFDELNQDIHCAVNLFVDRTKVSSVALWGLCDAASAAMMYAPSDARIGALILLNPWVHTDEIEARTRLKSYYLERLRSRQFWHKLFRLDLDLRDSIGSLAGYIRKALANRSPQVNRGPEDLHFIERMRLGLTEFNGRVFLILSGKDLTAEEFRSLIN